jgi:quercetin dioxygenase-like cupin family protein
MAIASYSLEPQSPPLSVRLVPLCRFFQAQPIAPRQFKEVSIMKLSRNAARLSLAIALGVFVAGRAIAVDFVEAAPKQTKVLVDNEKVRVIRATFKKGDKVPMHSHPDIVVYIIKGGGKTKFTMQDGKSFESDSKAGDATFRPAVTHSHEHLNDSEALVIELKK